MKIYPVKVLIYSILAFLLLVLNPLFAQKPTASFSVNTSSGCPPLQVQFKSTSLNAVSYFWDLGNGNTSTLQSPSNMYLNVGNYTITLIVTSAGGETDTVNASQYIQVISPPKADFESDLQAACPASKTIHFKNKSLNASNWIWDFGDGNTSTLKDPTYIYPKSGKYTVKLIAINAMGCKGIESKTDYIEIFEKPKGNFTVDAISSCDPNHSFQFTNKTANITSCQWQFGDGSTSNTMNPAHVYSHPGSFSVFLINVNTNSCADTLKANQLINLFTPSPTSILADQTNGCSPMEVNFKIDTTHIKSVLWSFGDSSTSTVTFPNHQYLTPGMYSVSAIITTREGCTYTFENKNYIHAGAVMKSNFTLNPQTGCAPLKVKFTNLSVNSNKWLWDFGDGVKSTQKNPTYTYQNNGTYDVKLISTNSLGCSSTFDIKAAVIVTPPIANFTLNNTPSCAPVTMVFNNTSVGSSSWKWNLGDGTSSTLQNPTHIYKLPGNYTVSLIAKGNGCSDTIEKKSIIQVINPNANYVIPPPIKVCAPYSTSFSDQTPGASSWNWNFGDGTTSNLQNPSHTYSKAGTYIVSLDISLSGGCTQSYPVFKKIIVQGGDKGFSIQTQACPPYISTCIDSSASSKSWQWIFGDGDTSHVKNPLHTYKHAGFFLVNIEIHDASGCVINTVISNAVGIPPCKNGVPDTTVVLPGGEAISHGTIFPGGDPDADTTGISSYFGPPVKGCIPLAVQFKNVAQHSINWHWDFGDGGSSAEENPIYQFTKPGTYVIKLIATYSDGSSDTIYLSNKVIVGGSSANFSYTQTNSCQDHFFQFKDASLYAQNYQWIFGDGTTSNAQNPGHHYMGNTQNYNVTLITTNSDGCTSSATKSIFSGNVNPVVWADNYEVCMDNASTIHCSIGDYTNYHWDFGDGSTSNQQNPTHIYTKSGSYAVKLDVTDQSGCNFHFALPDSMRVNYPQANFTQKISTVCNSLEVSFVNQSTGISLPLANNCIWDFGDGSSKENAANPIHTFLHPGNYDVTLSATYHGTCTSIIKKTIKVYPKVFSNFGITQDKTCLPIKASFSDSSSSAVKWLWNFGDGGTSNLKNPVHIYTTLPDSAITLTITDPLGCQSKSSQNILKIFKTHFTISDYSSCKLFSILFTDQSEGANQWKWSFGDGSFSNLQNPNHTYVNNGLYSVQLISSTPQGCSDTAIFYPVKINSPLADFSSPSPANCSPSLVTFTDKSINASGYKWDFGDGTHSNQSNPSHIYNTPGIYSIKLVVVNQDGCEDSVIKKNYITVLGPIAYFTTPKTKSCIGKEFAFTDSSSKAINWSWDFGDGNNSTQKNPKHIYTSTGTFAVTLIVNDSLGCSSVYTLPGKIDIGKVPVSGFQLNQNRGCNPITITPVNQSIHADAYIWKFGDKGSSSDANPSYSYDSAGTFMITLYAITNNGCIDSISKGPVVIQQSPLVDFISYPPSGCAPLLVSLNSKVSGDINASYSWKIGSYSSENINSSLLISDPGSYSISLVVTNKNGCSDTLLKQNQLVVYDQLPPEKSEIQYVTVESDTSVKIKWQQSMAKDFSKYVIYRKNISNGLWQMLDTLAMIDKTTYVDYHADPLHYSNCYKIQTSDICGNAISLEKISEHCSINVTATGIGKNIQVSWTPYVGAKPAYYELYRQKPGEAPVYINKFTTENLYLDESIACPGFNSYRIRAVALNQSSFNSFSDTSISKPRQNAFEQLKISVERTTVTEDKYILSEWYKPYKFKDEITGYKIYRSTDNTHFEYLTTLDPAAESYLDMDVNVNELHYFYKIKATNTCDLTTGNGPEGSSILLKAQLDDEGGAVELNWTKYENWNTDVDYYLIERKNENGKWEIIQKTDKNTLKMIDK